MIIMYIYMYIYIYRERDVCISVYVLYHILSYHTMFVCLLLPPIRDLRGLQPRENMVGVSMALA